MPPYFPCYQFSASPRMIFSRKTVAEKQRLLLIMRKVTMLRVIFLVLRYSRHFRQCLIDSITSNFESFFSLKLGVIHLQKVSICPKGLLFCNFFFCMSKDHSFSRFSQFFRQNGYFMDP